MVLLLSLLLACGGAGGVPDGPSAAEGAAAVAAEGIASIDEALLDGSWPVLMATESDFQSYVSAGGIALVMHRNYPKAAEALSGAGGPLAVRAHAEIAYTYRQAALLAAHSLIETYGETPEDTDPVGTAHLLSVSYALTGDSKAAKAQSDKLVGITDDPTLIWHAPWRAWLESGAAWPPDLSSLPIELPEPALGSVPRVTELPSYELPEQSEAARKREMADPAILIVLAMWHDRVVAGHGATGKAAHVLHAGYRWPVEAPLKGAADLDMPMLFGADLLVPGDGPFMAALHGPQGAAAVDAFKDRSLMAALAAAARVDGKVNGERAVDLCNELRTALVKRASARTENTVQGHQREFSAIAFVGSLRTLALVAEMEGDREVSGLLRINALEHSRKATADPVGLLALGAWDASNRYPTRAQDILHAQVRFFPTLEAARYGLDVMALRVSRERPGETPGM
jgi:hypothetical protein